MDQERRSPQGADATADTALGVTETSGMRSTTRIGIYFSAREFTAAKSAFLADWASGGDCDTFVKWVRPTRPHRQQCAGRYLRRRTRRTPGQCERIGQRRHSRGCTGCASPHPWGATRPTNSTTEPSNTLIPYAKDQGSSSLNV